MGRRYRADAGDESQQLPVLDFVAARSAVGLGNRKSERPRLLSAFGRRVARGEYTALCDALPLGSATDTARCRWLAESRCGRAVCGLRPGHGPGTGRPRVRLDALQ